MASHSYSDTCPNCENDMDAMEDSRDGSFAWCPHCGYTMVPTVSQCSLEELNERLENHCEANGIEFVPLDKLPEWKIE